MVIIKICYGLYCEHISGLIRAAIVEKADGETYWMADKEPYSFNFYYKDNKKSNE